MRASFYLRRLLLFGSPLALFLSGCSYSKIYSLRYTQAESVLLTRLKIDKTALVKTKQSLLRVDEPLAKYMSMKLYGVRLVDYNENHHLRIMASNEYDIGGTGSQSVMFDLEKIADDRTRLTVDFSDRSLTLFIIPYWNPGISRERHIAELIFDQANSTSIK